jgi:hypothetical protein
MSTGSSTRRLSYEPSVEKDRLSEGAQSDFVAVTPTLARRQLAPRDYQFYFHANSKVVAWEDNRDVSMGYKLLRLRRHWTGQLSQTLSNPIATDYVLDTKTDGPYGFGADSGTPKWIDTPGPKLRRARDYTRSLDEFIVGVGDWRQERSLVPGFGGLYFIVAIDITPAQYRVWMSLEKRLDDAQMQGAMGIGGAGSSLTSIAKSGPPDFRSFRYVPHDWQDYTQWTR